MITVFYDGQCGLCSKEINYFKQQPTQANFNWQDITASTTELDKEGITLAEGLKLLHAKDAQGKLHVGVDAFIVMWGQFAYWRWLAVLLAIPGMRQMANVAYRVFANWRFKRLPHCQLALKQDQLSNDIK